jgi:thiol-disulfide isomerase/thioredoxin
MIISKLGEGGMGIVYRCLMRKTLPNVLIFLLLMLSPFGVADADSPQTLLLGEPAPPLEGVVWLRGGPHDQWNAGHVYVLDFWATWCAPCLTQMPSHQALEERYAGKDVHVVGVAVWSNKGPMTPAKALERHPGLTYAVAEDVDNLIANTYMDGTKTRGLPAIMLVDGAGQMVWIGDPGNELDEALNAVLADSFDLDAARRKDDVRRRSQDLFKEIDEYRRSGQPGLAAARVDDVITLDEKRNGWAYAMKYEIIVTELDDMSAATEVAQDFISSKAGDDPYFNYVFVLRMLNAKDKVSASLWDAELALDLANRAVQMSDVPNSDYMAALARVYMTRGDLGHAIGWQQKALEAAPPAKRESLTATLREYKSAE